jgi:hypothetical protein
MKIIKPTKVSEEISRLVAQTVPTKPRGLANMSINKDNKPRMPAITKI